MRPLDSGPENRLSGLRRDEPLARLTTLELGGPARFVVEATDERTVRDALAWAADERLPVAVLAGGSNVVAADAGFDGLVLDPALRGVAAEKQGDRVRVTAGAGEPWDDLVGWSVEEGLAGLECLSGIPGTVGAAPIQNIGAYGQEVADTIVSVRVIDRKSLETAELPSDACGFTYRSSSFRRQPDRSVVLAVTFALRIGGGATIRYPELASALGGHREPTLEQIRAAVLALRRSKSMVVDQDDENRRSVGSFFLNPSLLGVEADDVAHRAVETGAIRKPLEMPRFPAAAGTVRIPAGWLIERAGFAKGTRRGAVGISSRHALALVHHGGGTAADLVAFAREVRDAVRDRFGVTLLTEPTFLGFRPPNPLDDAP